MKPIAHKEDKTKAKVSLEDEETYKILETAIDSSNSHAQTGIPMEVRKTGLHLFLFNLSRAYKLDELGREIARIAVPAALALTADPLASLVDTAFVGQIGSVELAAVGVSIAIFNQASKIAIFPLVSVTTSFVAEDDAIWSSNIVGNEDNGDPEDACSSTSLEMEELRPLNGSGRCEDSSNVGHRRKYIPSASSALIVGTLLGLLQAILLIFAAKPLLNLMGVRSDSLVLDPAYRYLTLRSLGAPAVLLSLAMQGIFRGLKDTKTPLYATVAGDATNIVLDAIFIFGLGKGVTGAAIAHVTSQFLITSIMFYTLVKRVDVIPPSFQSLNLSRFLRCGFLLLARVMAVTFCMTLGASLASHHGVTTMAAFQICFQVWLATSLLADGLAVAAQAMLASAFAKQDYPKIVAITARVLQLSIVFGLILSLVLGVGMKFGAGIFTKDPNVMKIIHKGLPFVAATQPINTLAFIFDGINFGASDYKFSAFAMVGVASISIPCLIFFSWKLGFIGIWIALTIYMSMRTLASIWRMGAARGPWTFLRKESNNAHH